MSPEGFSERGFLAAVQALSTGATLRTTDVVAQRISSEHTSLAPASDVQEMTSTGLRKISPQADPENLPISLPPASEKAPALLDRLVSLFKLASDHGPQPSPVRFAKASEQVEQAATGAHDLTQAIDRFETSQQFATGIMLLSSLTQSVMSSSKRLSQGQ
ncbi:hypothetical protein GGE07_005884 [Sinorhizobium terangae]|uniref:Uncharacterized protein n=1 Tax=Sinorhizobium terangae TaxID=110322 RepID=A0A6N7LK82_SINTE|nr:hypothetical protein [Sinorhizobium terangae]MBB4189203.1 hypothetical protein [Sinorhizobium terangae]MQX18273.1 hypothetical protein [Sinorhizobium terangae]